MPKLSDFASPLPSLQGQAGGLAINVGDVVELAISTTSIAQLFSAKTTDYAAVSAAFATCVAATSLGGYGAVAGTQRREIYQSAVDGSILILTGGSLSVQKYSAAGALLATAVLDSGNTFSNCFYQVICALPNGNYSAVWQTPSGTLYFAVFDLSLNIVTAKTAVAALSGGNYFSAIPLSGGGFAVAYPMSTGAFLAIYSNSGSVVSAGAVMTGTPTAGLGLRLVQQSGGNIVCAINSSTTNKALGHAIYSQSGVLVSGYAVLDGATSAGSQFPEVSAITGFYCCSAWNGTNLTAYVLNNAGVLQGAPYSVAVASYGMNYGNLNNDGAAFWLLYFDTGGAGNSIVFLPSAGTGYVNTNVFSPGEAPTSSFIEHGTLVIAGIGSLTTFSLLPTGVPFNKQIGTLVLPSATYNSTTSCALPAGDFSAMVVGYGASAQAFGVQKYASTALLGVAQNSVPAGSAGSLVSINEGPGGYPCNLLIGTVGKAYDHSAATPIGNKGTLYSNSLTMKGI